MTRIGSNRAAEMEVFVCVVERGGFSAAARASRMTPSAVSKLVARLEARLGARLLNRSTRAVQLTPEGRTFYEKAARILADINDAERSAAAGEKPVGRVRLNTSASYATHVLYPVLAEFLERYPGVELDLVQTDALVNLLAERTDVAVRAGPLESSRLVARKLGEAPMVVVGSPSYIARFGDPKAIDELERHNRLGFGYARAMEGWPMKNDGGITMIPAAGRVQASDGEALRRLALAGVGLARLTSFTVQEDIRSGRLVSVLEHLNPGDREEFHAVYIGHGGPLPSRVRALLDYLAEKGRVA